MTEHISEVPPKVLSKRLKISNMQTINGNDTSSVAMTTDFPAKLLKSCDLEVQILKFSKNNLKAAAAIETDFTAKISK